MLDDRHVGVVQRAGAPTVPRCTTSTASPCATSAAACAAENVEAPTHTVGRFDQMPNAACADDGFRVHDGMAGQDELLTSARSRRRACDRRQDSATVQPKRGDSSKGIVPSILPASASRPRRSSARRRPLLSTRRCDDPLPLRRGPSRRRRRQADVRPGRGATLQLLRLDVRTISGGRRYVIAERSGRRSEVAVGYPNPGYCAEIGNGSVVGCGLRPVRELAPIRMVQGGGFC